MRKHLNNLAVFVALATLGCGGESGPGDVCDPNPCTAVQGPVCDGDLLLVYASPGTCTSSGIEALCTYPLESTTDCSTSGQVCDPASAACVECLRHSDCPTDHVCDDKSCRFVGDPCDPNPCTAPPDPTCNGELLETYVETGTCSDNGGTASCDYAVDSSTDCTASDQHCNAALAACAECANSSHCDEGYACVDGACVESTDICDPNPCDVQPDPACNGDTLETYAATGTCSDNGGAAVCDYPVASSTDCTSTGEHCNPALVACAECADDEHCSEEGETCVDGACMAYADPCDPNPCTESPAPACNGDTLETYAATGNCSDNGGTAACDYPVDSSTDCTTTSQYCNADLAACAECGDDSHCTWPYWVCETGVCVTGCQDDAFEDNDLLSTAHELPGAGTWNELVLCANDADYYGVALAGGQEIAVDIIFTHAAGNLNLFLYDPTDNQVAAATSNSNNENLSYGVGMSAGGVYKILVVGADTTVQNIYSLQVSISDDPCLPNPCTNPPGTECAGNVLTTYASPGTCTNNAGSPECDYAPDVETDCSLTGAVCQNLACEGRFADVGDLLITEIMNNPAAVNDDMGEWFEVKNLSAELINLRGLVIRDLGADSITVQTDVLVQPDAYALLGNNADFGTNGGVTLDYAYSPTSFYLGNSDDELIIERDAALIDMIAWDDGLTFPNPNGTSFQLDINRYTVDENDIGGFWCESTTLMGSGDYGTPGADNEDCGLVTYDPSWCKVQFPTSILATPGASGAVYGHVYAAGLTDQSAGVDVAPALLAQVGYGAAGSDPTAGGWSWFDAIANPAWNDALSPNNDEYMGTVTVPAAAGEYDLLYRFSGDFGLNWITCDVDGVGFASPVILDTQSGPHLDFSASPAQAIPEGGETISVINADWFQVGSLTVEVNITHPSINELSIELISPAGTSILLYDGGATGVDLLAHYGAGDIPLGDLASFVGEQSANAWTLRVRDIGGLSNGGTLNSWALHFTAQ